MPKQKRKAASSVDPLAFNLEKAARTIGVSTPTMRKLIQNQEVEVVRIGRRILISRQALEDFLKGRAA